VITTAMVASGPSFEEELATADPALGRVIAAVVDKIGQQRITPSRVPPFEAIARAIVYQSVSGKASAVIFARLKQAVGGTISPAGFLAMSEVFIMSAGLSKSKSHAILKLAEWFIANPKMAKTLPDLSDEEVVAALAGITGIGAWTANVFLIFDLGRLDVMPAADLGIRRGVQLVCGLKGVATARQVHEKALLWRPYRSIASVYLWNAVKLKIAPNDLT
jgi:DNA-3-methyladenine glycosylase II